MNNEIEKNMVILHIDNYNVSQKEEEFFDGFILCNFEYDEVTMSDIYEEDVIPQPQYKNIEHIELNKLNAIMSSSTLLIESILKEEDTSMINENERIHYEPVETIMSDFQEQEEDHHEDNEDNQGEMEPMTSSTSSVDTEEEQELENQIIYYKTTIETFEGEIKSYEKMLSGLIYKNISLYKYKFIFVNNNNMYNLITRKIEELQLSKKKYEKTLEDILKLQLNDKTNY